MYDKTDCNVHKSSTNLKTGLHERAMGDNCNKLGATTGTQPLLSVMLKQ